MVADLRNASSGNNINDAANIAVSFCLQRARFPVNTSSLKLQTKLFPTSFLVNTSSCSIPTMDAANKTVSNQLSNKYLVQHACNTISFMIYPTSVTADDRSLSTSGSLSTSSFNFAAVPAYMSLLDAMNNMEKALVAANIACKIHVIYAVGNHLSIKASNVQNVNDVRLITVSVGYGRDKADKDLYEGHIKDY
ncbi:hypothetical protein NE237_019641 [Protea cynaroides]|uniref:Uncharacterized protein n=1 Tax=Protea cynaroides TaxID=273540 RepID=A0A9Q0K1K1_9MAGN|nr:hypothetical protein NE237_019641 [Protea cynaroides]